MSDATLSQGITALRGVGPKLAEKLANLGITTQQDLLFHLPLRYEDRTTLSPIGGLQVGNTVLIQGEIRAADISFGRRRSLVVKVQDGTGLITLRFFHFNSGQKSAFKTNAYIRCFGEVRKGSAGLEIYHPEYQISEQPIAAPQQQNLTPVYPTVQGLQQKTWRSLIQQALNSVRKQPPHDYLAHQQNNISLIDALAIIHQPPPETNINALQSGEHPAMQRLILEELAAQYIAHQRIRYDIKTQAALPMAAAGTLSKTFLSTLPFTPTDAQQRVSTEIHQDMCLAAPMLRLVQGDVGSGKTLVAALAVLHAIENGYQAALMAPTEILAEQHFHNFCEWCEPLNIRVGFLASSVKGKKRVQLLEALACGDIQLLIGTHAIFQSDIVFKQLALVVVDEQHRFGVHQRLELKQKGGAYVPHQLVMTATPIPRTLTMTQFAELDCSIIDELPPGRKPITTTLLDASRREKLIERVRNACEQGQQAYWVCTLVEESELLQAEAAESTAITLSEAIAPLHVGLIHGRLKSAEKAELMAHFKAGEIDLLVATTVIEVGVDVPNANLMVIENPERLGLAQLHQLRGRVGRGQQASHCVLLFQKPLSQNGKRRLEAMRSSTDGFYIAEQDLAIRGPGEILGTRQTGELAFKIADIERDAHLIDYAQTIGKALLAQLNTLQCEQLVKRWLAGKTVYAEV